MPSTICAEACGDAQAVDRPLLGRHRPPEADSRSVCYGQIVARGFDSKAVESQQEEAQRPRTLKPALTPEEVERQSRKAGLELALAQTQAEMTASCKPAHREMLKLKLEAIQSQIRDL
jgi:hypothetical protein